MNQLPDLHGHHLWLRELRPTDHAPFERIHTHRVLTRYLGIDRMDARQAQDAFVQCLTQPFSYPRRKHTMAVCAPGDDTMVGMMGLLVEEYGRNAMLTSLVLLPGAPMRGHGHEAGRLLMAHGFGRLGLYRIWAGHRADHTRMRDIMLAAGLHPEATLRGLFRTQGAWHDVTTYAALAPEWIEQATPAERAILDGTPAEAPEHPPVAHLTPARDQLVPSSAAPSTP
ncbi:MULTISPECIES: GNAT family protein [unclassified Streptomyces]|uniref:GNAT family N-acetyltransferase n=1 Tax=unclassified Streptomyces TaxID=2593676 RepID=UPI000DB96BF4|nr:GNAT family protein [Streptomyces sp. PsTaAH-137]MYT68800.1 GNAT family N-acetyltransferase [Streptomyces sp. SID8367]RAJ86473.1 RimJ/RimL family protein N-acetyltransferase [Streptomyces sp. PsTaAH-137]